MELISIEYFILVLAHCKEMDKNVFEPKKKSIIFQLLKHLLQMQNELFYTCAIFILSSNVENSNENIIFM